MARPSGSSNNALYRWAQAAAGLFVSAPVANASLADMAASTFKGRNSGGGSGPPQDLTATQATALLDVFGAAKGLVPANGGATTAFLRGDGTFAAVSTPAAATQAEQEAASSLTAFVSPGRQQFHPSACKVWARWNASVSIAASYNVSSVTDNGVGDWTVNFTTAFSTANYGCSGFCGFQAGGPNAMVLNATTTNAGSCRVGGYQGSDGAHQDPDSPNLITFDAFGDQ